MAPVLPLSFLPSFSIAIDRLLLFTFTLMNFFLHFSSISFCLDDLLASASGGGGGHLPCRLIRLGNKQTEQKTTLWAVYSGVDPSVSELTTRTCQSWEFSINALTDSVSVSVYRAWLTVSVAALFLAHSNVLYWKKLFPNVDSWNLVHFFLDCNIPFLSPG